MDIAIHEVTKVAVTEKRVTWLRAEKPFHVTTLLIYSGEGTQEIKLFGIGSDRIMLVMPNVAAETVVADKPTTQSAEPF